MDNETDSKHNRDQSENVQQNEIYQQYKEYTQHETDKHQSETIKTQVRQFRAYFGQTKFTKCF